MGLDYGPLQTLLDDPSVTEVMVNSWDRIFAEQKGLITEVPFRFVDDRQYREMIHQLVFQLHSSSEQTNIRYDGVLPSGYRYNITLPPMSPQGPTLTIRKFSNKIFNLNELAQEGCLSDKAAQFLDAAVKARASIVVSGGTGTGKTTILNSLANCIPAKQRIVTIEDVPELKIPLRNWISLVTVEKPTSITARDCLINALRMRPDRIIVGECRKDETFEMLQAMNTGHDGSMTTIHANSASDALSRMESLIMYSKFEIPMKVLRYQMSEAIDLIIQLRRLADGRREVSEIVELTGMEIDVITRGVIFARDKNGVLSPTGYVPEVLKKIRQAQIPLADAVFDPGVIQKARA
ncbi:MAG: hypothetical protein BroJett040_15330 [Oligoflexia bacterium]|nr:MAG: hypothetical protein BroJett040_15330 [Oligoflexia bacterium]